MVTLKNIKRLDNIICADCYIENDETISFTIYVDAKLKKIIKFSLDEMNTYVYMASKRLYRLFEENEDIPKQLIYTWY